MLGQEQRLHEKQEAVATGRRGGGSGEDCYPSQLSDLRAKSGEKEGNRTRSGPETNSGHCRYLEAAMNYK